MADQTFARYINERRVLTLLRTDGPMPRAEVARRLSLTPATITNLVSSLSERSLVTELKTVPRLSGRGEVGRPGVSIALDEEGAYFLGVEVGVGYVRFALLDFALNVADTSYIEVDRAITPDAVVALVAKHVASLKRRQPTRDRLRSVGITVPGLVRSDGFVVHLPILGWHNVNLRELATRACDLPVSIENNANAAAFGEIYTQPSLPSDCVVYLKLGTGCGGAAILNGRLLRGASGTGAELGHIRITETGPPCSCGQVGCLEPWVNLDALARAFGMPEDLPDHDLAALPAEVARLAGRGNERAIEAIRLVAKHLAVGMTTLVNVFNPSTMLLGGTMRPVLACCLEDVAAAVAAQIVPGIAPPVIRLTTFGEAESAAGAAAIAHHEAFDVLMVDVEASVPSRRSA